MENEKSEHVIRSAVAGATRMPSDGTDDDEVRERGAFPEVCFHCGRPNPVSHLRAKFGPLTGPDVIDWVAVGSSSHG